MHDVLPSSRWTAHALQVPFEVFRIPRPLRELRSQGEVQRFRQPTDHLPHEERVFQTSACAHQAIRSGDKRVRYRSARRSIAGWLSRDLSSRPGTLRRRSPRRVSEWTPITMWCLLPELNSECHKQKSEQFLLTSKQHPRELREFLRRGIGWTSWLAL